LNAKVEKENESNDECSARKVRLKSCVAQKNGALHSNNWEEQFVQFKAHVDMSAVGSVEQ